MKMYIKILVLFALMFVFYKYFSHHSERSEQVTQVVSLKKSVNSVLYFSGTIEPLDSTVVTSPADGVISGIQFHFGDEVKKNQPLFFMTSDKFEADYKTALMQYIKTKTDYVTDESQMKESEFLHKNQLISDDDYKSKQTSFYNARLSMVQAKEALDHLQKQIDLHGVNFYDLNIQDINKITEVLHEQNALRQIRLVSPADGVVLLSNKDESNGELKKIHKGDSVHQGDVIAVIGNVNGFTLHIDVGEMDVNQLRVGQPVKITGTAFPDSLLSGEITAIDRQGESVQGGPPVFSVEIVARNLTQEQQKYIHIGMTAKVAIDTDGAPKLTVPIKAIVEKDGQTFLTVKKNGKTHQVLVKTGETTLDSVVIQSGISPGESIVFTDQVG